VDGAVDDELRRCVAAAREGDAAAWEQLFRRLYPRLRVYAANRVAPDAVEDVVNETMARASASIERFVDSPSGFDAWVFGIARHAAADHQRRLARYRRGAGHRVDVEPTRPEESVELAADHAQIRAAFAKLSAAEREVLELRVIAGLTAEEAAKVLRKRAGTVRVAQHRALTHLRAILDERR
jgi:RNA polymerase sigma-70 factor (ECF subfamily)